MVHVLLFFFFSASMTSPDNFFSPSEMKDAASPARYSLGVHVPDGAPHKSRDWSRKHLMCELKTNSLHKSRDPFNRGRQPSLRFPLLIPLLVALTKKKKRKKKSRSIVRASRFISCRGCRTNCNLQVTVVVEQKKKKSPPPLPCTSSCSLLRASFCRSRYRSHLGCCFWRILPLFHAHGFLYSINVLYFFFFFSPPPLPSPCIYGRPRIICFSKPLDCVALSLPCILYFGAV